MDEQQVTPELVLDTAPIPTPELALQSSEPITPDMTAQQSRLTDQELRQVEEFARKIDVTDSALVLQYGTTAQKKLSTFSENALSHVKGKDMGEIGDMITGLVVELKGFNPEEEKKGFAGFFKRAATGVTSMKAKYDSVEKNVDKISDTLEGHKMTLLKDVAMLDKLYEMNVLYYKELSMYILAGYQKLKETRETELPALREKAKASGLPEDAQAANHLNEMCLRFEKKLYDLDTTRTVSLQMAPQIRLVQQNNSVMVDKIQSSISNTIPLWKNQMVLSLGLAHSQSAIQAQRQVTDITNELLKKNADTLKMNTVAAARESERAIVDIETLKHVNESLIATLDEVVQIQQEGREKRQAAEGELRRIENDLKNKLLEVKNS